MSEFKLINKFINRAKTDNTVELGIGDDAAVLNIPRGFQLIQTLDTMVEGVHFDERFSADALAHKLLHVNLSDCAAMGATPKWATVALTMPSKDEAWLDEFSKDIQSRCAEIGLNLVGGDTTSGPLTVSLNLTGIVKTNEYLTRSGAQEGDDVYVTGTLGDAALALDKKGANSQQLLKRLLYPQARLNVGEKLYGIATACIDLSDGLLADLGHICENSKLSAKVRVENLPFSLAYLQVFEEEANPDFALNGGDDYELCFTANESQRKAIEQLSKELGCPIIRVGQMRAYKGSEAGELVSTELNGKPYSCSRNGWQHFAD